VITVVALFVASVIAVAFGVWLTDRVYQRKRAAQFEEYEAATPSRARSLRTIPPHLRVVHDRSRSN
jgi:hypothetical protein